MHRSLVVSVLAAAWGGTGCGSGPAALADATQADVTWFTGPRDTRVEAVAPAAGGELALAGIRNGPTTAPGQSASNEGWVGIVSAASP